MKKTIVLIGMCCSTLLLTNCAEKRIPPKTPQPPVDEVAEVKQKYNAAQLAQGKIVYDQNCGKCHELHQPAEYTVPKWDRILVKMCKKAGLNAEQSGIVRAWVITNAKQG